MEYPLQLRLLPQTFVRRLGVPWVNVHPFGLTRAANGQSDALVIEDASGRMLLAGMDSVIGSMVTGNAAVLLALCIALKALSP